MATIVGRFKLQKLAKYPHMKPADIEIWERFIEAQPDFFDSVDYDFHVGRGADFLPDEEDTPDGRENRLYRKKIDVVGYKKNQIWIIEVKPVADATALGQVLSYREFYIKKKGDSPKPISMVVCGKIFNEMKDLFSIYKITVFVV